MAETSGSETVKVLQSINAKLSLLLDAAQSPQSTAPEHHDVVPSGLGGWDPDIRTVLMRYLRYRDNDRCGLCGNVMSWRPGHEKLHIVSHIVPLDTPCFDVSEGQATQGDRYRSVQSHRDNLQIVHAYCNDRWSGTRFLPQWRHRSLPEVPVAEAGDGSALKLPLSRLPWPKPVPSEPPQPQQQPAPDIDG